jgi:hypothetical protein
VSFIDVDVEPGPTHEDGVSLRFKRSAGAETRAITWVQYESEDGLDGRWSVRGADSPEGPHTRMATATQVDDSSDGTAWLIAGGRHGLVLTHEDTGAVERAPYLVLSLRTALG